MNKLKFEGQIFGEGVTQLRWVEVLAGFLRGWIGIRTISEWVENKSVIWDDDDYALLYLKSDGSIYDYVIAMAGLIRKHNGMTISKSDIDRCLSHPDYAFSPPFDSIPFHAFEIWQLEFLFQIMSTTASYEQKIESTYDLYYNNKAFFKTDMPEMDNENMMAIYVPGVSALSINDINSEIRRLKHKISLSRYDLQ